MTPQERALVEDLFDRIARTPAGQQDQEAVALIGRRMTADPNAAYALVQTTLVQAEALRQAEAKMAELQRSAPQGSGSFLSGAGSPWSRAGAAPPPAPQPMQQTAPMAGPWAAPQAGAPSQAGGFLRSAMTTAAGVAGGALLFEGIRNMFGGGHAFGNSLGGFGNTPVVNETINENVFVEQPRDRDDNRYDVADDDTQDDDTDWSSSDDDRSI